MTAPAFHLSLLRSIAAVAFLACTATRAAQAAEASEWDKGDRSAARLVAGAATRHDGKRVLRAGIELQLVPGWKTYWRYPGDAGVPPRFDFSGSRNVKDVEVLFPAPRRFEDAGQFSIGYTQDLILPLRITPQDPNAPASVKLKLDYAVCEKLCVPVDAQLELTLDGKRPTAHDDALRASEALVPKPAALGAAGPLAIVAVRQEAGGGKPRVVVDIAAKDAKTLDLFAEGPRADWSLPLPEPVDGAPAGLRRFAFEIDGMPPDTDPRGARITLTAVSEDGAIQVPFTLD